MRKILKHFVINVVVLYLVTRSFAGLSIANGLNGLIVAGVGLTMMILLARPIINLLLLPLNLVTFGLFKWVSSALSLYLTTLLVPGFRIMGFHFGGLSTKWIDIPTLDLSGFLALVAFSLVISLFSSLIYWLVK